MTTVLTIIGLLGSLVGQVPATFAEKQHNRRPNPQRVQAADARLFGPNSFWNTRLPRSAGASATNDALAASLRRVVAANIADRSGPWINTTQYSTPLYVVSASQPTTPVKLDGKDPMLAAELAKGVPIPSGAVPAKGTDRHMTIWQPATDTLWDFIAVERRGDGWHIGWGGVMHDVSAGPGRYLDRKGPNGEWIERTWWGSTASALPVVGGTVLVDEARSGAIPHVLAMSVPNTCKSKFVWPAARNDGTDTSSGCIPEGTRFRLDPKFDVDRAQMPRFTKMLARAAQTYGIVVRDTAPIVTFYAEDPTRYGRDVWTTDGLLGARPWDLVWEQFPWRSLRTVPQDTGR